MPSQKHFTLGFGKLTERHEGGISVPPIGADNIFLDEGKHVLDNIVLAASGQEHQANAGRLARVPVVFVVVLLLLRELLHQHRAQVLQSSFGVELGRPDGRPASFLGLGVLDGKVRLLVAHVRPKLDSLERYFVDIRLHRFQSDLQNNPFINSEATKKTEFELARTGRGNTIRNPKIRLLAPSSGDRTNYPPYDIESMP